ncbi:MAG: ABC transporter ATP-binding protein/permease [Lachnospiraceae bacterium]|nr:ABC transporter ATP-binding protein/permease [Lachnospiraceae bacterium]
MIRVKDLNKSYDSSHRKVEVLRDASVSLPGKGMCFFVGKSGSGKSTFLNVLGGITGGYSGEVVVDGKELSGFSEEQWNDYRNREIGIVFQHYGLFEHQSVLENVLLPVLVTNRDEKEARSEAHTLLDYVGLEGLKQARVSQLSGGEKQRVAIARALINHPKILLADEPTGNLDNTTSQDVLKLFKKISQNCLVCIVSHDMEAADKYGDFVFRISEGRVVTERDVSEQTLYDVTITTTANDAGLQEGPMTLEQFRRWLPEAVCSVVTGEGRAVVELRERRENGASRGEVAADAKEGSDEKSFARCGLSWLRAAKTAFRKTPVAWVKSIGGMIVLAVLMLFAYILWNLHTYRPEKAAYRYLSETGIDYVMAEKTASYRDSRGDEEEKTVSSGRVFREGLQSILGESRLLPRLKEQVLTVPDSLVSSRVDIYVTEKLPEYLKIDGKYPEKPNEIAISNRVVQELNLDGEIIGQELVYNHETFVVTGLLSYEMPIRENPYFVQAKTEVDNVLSYYDIEANLLACINPSYISRQRETDRSVEFQYGNPAFCDWETALVSGGEAYYGAALEEYGISLVEGRLPEREDEVIVSENMLWEQGIVGKKRSVISTWDERFNDAFSDSLALSEYFPDGITVVGVYDSLQTYYEYAQDDEPDVLVCPSVFERIRKDYYEEYCYGKYVIPVDGAVTEDTLARLAEAGYTITEPNVKLISDFDRSRDRLDFYFVAAFAAVLLCAFLMALLTISVSIRDRWYLLGIMRSVGFSGKDFLRMFLTEAFFVSTIPVLLSTVAFLWAQAYANRDYLSAVTANPFELLVFGPWKTICLAVVCFLICIVAAIIPIRGLLRKKPDELIRAGNRE